MKLGVLMVLAAIALAACDDDGEPRPRWEIDITPADLSTAVDNPLLPFEVGSMWQYKAVTDEGIEITTVEVLADVELVWGVSATVVRDRVFLDDELVEDTFDWYAQDTEGNVWYLGEDSCEIDDDECVDRSGSWEAGVNGALPGIAMLADPRRGDLYFQEFAIGEAEDEARVVEVDVIVDTALGRFAGCVTTQDFTRLEPGHIELKVYCPEIGLVREVGEFVVDLVLFHGR